MYNDSRTCNRETIWLASAWIQGQTRQNRQNMLLQYTPAAVRGLPSNGSCSSECFVAISPVAIIRVFSSVLPLSCSSSWDMRGLANVSVCPSGRQVGCVRRRAGTVFLRGPRGVGIAVGIHGFVRRADDPDSGKSNHQFLDVAQPVPFQITRGANGLFPCEAKPCLSERCFEARPRHVLLFSFIIFARVLKPYLPP